MIPFKRSTTAGRYTLFHVPKATLELLSVAEFVQVPTATEVLNVFWRLFQVLEVNMRDESGNTLSNLGVRAPPLD